MFLSDNNKITAASSHTILLLIHKTLSALHILHHLILSVTLGSSTIIVIPILQRTKLSQREVKWHAQGSTAMKCLSWNCMGFCG